MRFKILVLALVLTLGGSTLALAQDRDDQDRSGMVYNNGYPVYQNGYPVYDQYGNPVHDRYGNPVYQSGYPVYDQFGNPVYDQYGNPVYQNGYPIYYANTAQHFGFEDGLNDGSRDRATGHSFRPAQQGSFRAATHGFGYGNGMNVNQYRSLYRQAYEAGYQQGYNGNGYGYYNRRHRDDDDRR